ncbi:hypothetical protein BJX65DRAFT_300814 [Aspergillus insuetus]
MLPTTLLGLSNLQTLRSRLSGRLARIKPSDVGASGSLERRSRQNEASFFEADLRHLFITLPMIVSIPDDTSDDFEQRAHELLSALNDIVNHELIEALISLERNAADKSPIVPKENTISHDLASLSRSYPELSALLSLLELTTAQFNLATGQGSSLFILSQGVGDHAAVASVAEMKDILSRILYDSNKQSTPTLTSPLPTENETAGTLDQPSDSQDALPRRYASIIVNTLLNDFRKRGCGSLHEIKLKVSDNWQTSPRDVPLDMFLSCCFDQLAWHQAKCGSFQAAINEARKDGICAAISRARDQGRSIHLSVDKDGLLDISDIAPVTPLSAADYTTETLEQLLEHKALTRITANDCRSDLVEEKLGTRQKAILALGLARCLMEFFDADVELASHSWKPESVHFLRSPRRHGRDRILYISLRPLASDSLANTISHSVGAIGPGNPILLSFARLLLEIESGEKIPIQIHTESKANLATWGEMCGIVERFEREGGGNYLRAVEGCLYLHMALRNSQEEETELPFADRLRKAIHDQIVRNLEVNVDPQSTKRKRQDLVSELPLAKKLSIAALPPTADHNSNRPPITKKSSPTNRNDFEIAVVCALPREYDAVYMLFDEVWNLDYGRTDGDQNIYTHGRIGKFNVVLLVLPGMGKVSAARASTSLRLSYQRLSLVLVTGICGGVPFTESGDEVLLGDVIISRHVVQYDLGRQYPDEFEVKDTVEDKLGRAPSNIRHLLTMLQTFSARVRLEELAARYLQDMQQSAAGRPRGCKYLYPGASRDLVFDSSYQHKRRLSGSLSLKTLKKKMHGSSEPYSMSCEEAGCDLDKVIPRERIAEKRHLEKQGRIIDAQTPSIFLGTIGSADTVMKSAEERDRIAGRVHREDDGDIEVTNCLVIS